jgi:hypothetical protein
MAIIVEEEKKKTGGWAMITWFVIVVIVLAAGYYLFLAEPPAANITPSSNVAALAPLSPISVTPQNVTDMASFKALASPVPPVATSGPAAVGRVNPFVAP